MIPLISRLLSFLLEDDTKLNPYAGGDGEYRAACPLQSPASWTRPRGGPAVPGLRLHSQWGRGNSSSSLRFLDLLLGGKAGAPGHRPARLKEHVSPLEFPILGTSCGSLLLNIHPPKTRERRRLGCTRAAWWCAACGLTVSEEHLLSRQHSFDSPPGLAEGTSTLVTIFIGCRQVGSPPPGLPGRPVSLMR